MFQNVYVLGPVSFLRYRFRDAQYMNPICNEVISFSCWFKRWKLSVGIVNFPLSFRFSCDASHFCAEHKPRFSVGCVWHAQLFNYRPDGLAYKCWCVSKSMIELIGHDVDFTPFVTRVTRILASKNPRVNPFSHLSLQK